MKLNKKMIIGILAVIVLLGAGSWFYFFLQGEKYYSTDNAKVMSDLKTITSTTGGEIVKWDAELNTLVNENQVIGRFNNGADIKSPITGIVAKTNAVLNQTVSPGSPLAIIADVNDIYIQANIEEKTVAKIMPGQVVQIKLDAYPGKQFKGHIREVDTVTVAALSGNATSFSTSGTYTKVTQLIPVKIAFDEPVELARLIGTNALVKINMDKIDQSAIDKDKAAKSAASGLIETTGKVKAKNVKDVVLDFSATIAAVPVTDGQNVHLSDVLVQLDLRDLRKQIADQERNLKIENLQLQKLENGTKNSLLSEGNLVDTAADNLAKAKEDVSKQEQLFAVGATTSEALADAKRRLAASERSFNDASLSKTTDLNLSIEIEKQKIAMMQDQLKQLKAKLEKGHIAGDAIVSDFENAVVQNLSLIPGDVLMANTKLLTLVDLSSLIIEADIPENQISQAQIGSTVDIVPVFDTTKHYTGKIVKLAASGTVKNGETVVVAEIAIDNADSSLMPNFNVDVKIGAKK